MWQNLILLPLSVIICLDKPQRAQLWVGYVIIYCVFLRLGFILMSATVLRCDVEKTLFRVSIIDTQKFVQLSEQQAFRKPIILAGSEPAPGISALRALWSREESPHSRT